MESDLSPAAGETIGQRLKRLRLERNLSQRELAAPGVSYAYISRIEAGSRQPSVKALRRLAAKLGVSAHFLETGSDIAAEEDRELRLSDVELAIRLGETEGAEETLRELVSETVAAGDRSSARGTRRTPTRGFGSTGRSRASPTPKAARERHSRTSARRSPCSRRPRTRSTSPALTCSRPRSRSRARTRTRRPGTSTTPSG